MLGPAEGNLKVGPGDDAALFKASSKDVLATTDMLVEDVDFNFKLATPYEIGWRALAANLSDIAAMGGWPSYALIAIAAKHDTPVERIMAICKGMMRLGERFGCKIAGGDLSSTRGPITLSVTVIGFSFGRVFLRKSARPGDKIFVTGWPGRASFALKKGRLAKIIPRLEEIKYLSHRIKINALIDTSDGISSDLTRICEESKVGAILYEENLPVAPENKKIKWEERIALVLNGGEDFELLLTTPEKKIDSLISQFKRRFKIPLTLIGEITQKSYGVKIFGKDGKERELKAKGWEHFKTTL
jgi:thiamine-monophosphate kinase